MDKFRNHKYLKTESEEGYEKLTESEVCNLVALIISYVLSGKLKLQTEQFGVDGTSPCHTKWRPALIMPMLVARCFAATFT